MRISDTIFLTKSLDGNFYLVDNGTETAYGQNDPCYNGLCRLYRALVATPAPKRAEVYKANKETVFNGIAERAAERAARPAADIIREGISKMMNFFTEFAFVPNFRFLNTVAAKMTETHNKKEVCHFIYNYFALTDSPYTKEIEMKIKSKEFQTLLDDFGVVAPKSRINSRFKVYYGAAGSGKTTKAQSETENRCVVCNNSMLPADLMEDFVFAEGKPTFKKSILWECMEQGKPIVLDEINLLPFDSLRFLQGVLDGKREFSYKGHNVAIADGFCVIGTMNLVVNGAVFNLPEPLVDRAADIVEFNLTAEQLASAIL